jgi:hypothetical protein
VADAKSTVPTTVANESVSARQAQRRASVEKRKRSTSSSRTIKERLRTLAMQMACEWMKNLRCAYFSRRFETLRKIQDASFVEKAGMTAQFLPKE